MNIIQINVKNELFQLRHESDRLCLDLQWNGNNTLLAINILLIFMKGHIISKPLQGHASSSTKTKHTS